MKTRKHSSVIDPYQSSYASPAASFQGPYSDSMGEEDLAPLLGVDFTPMGRLPNTQGFSGVGEMVDKIPGGYITIGGLFATLVGGGLFFFMKKGKKKKKK